MVSYQVSIGMDQEQTRHEAKESTRPAAPPTQPGALSISERRPVWPSVVGVIAIVLAALAFLGGVWAFVSWPFFGRTGGAFDDRELLKVMERWGQWVTISSVVVAVLGIPLLYGGIMLVKRRASGIRVIVAWAVLEIVAVVFSESVQYLMTQDKMTAIGNMGGGAGSASPTIYPLMTAGSTLIFGWAFPVFCLVWFSRKKVREHVATWVDR
jgi:hypothetical protein